jgi:glycosyltransferase involved in cell wall biosynthesis
VPARVPSPADQPLELVDLLTCGPPARRQALVARVGAVLQTLDATPPVPDAQSLTRALDRVLSTTQPDGIWLACAVITGQLPDEPEVRRVFRAGRLGAGPAELVSLLRDYGQLSASTWPSVEIVASRVVVDLHHTAHNFFTTGIQRVSREAARRWSAEHEIVFAAWTEKFRSYRRLTAEESASALSGIRPSGVPEPTTEPPAEEHDVIVPWKCIHIVPELPAEPDRARRYRAFAAFSGSSTGLVGYDCVPLTLGETSSLGMTLGFGYFLSAAAQVDRIAAISEGSAAEFEGWRTMLGGTGQRGPDIQAIPLGITGAAPSAVAIEEARRLVGIDSLPVVLVVGSHEPRKNHLSVLHAAERLWREGLLFSLTFVGGNAWKSAPFEGQVEELQRLNRPLQIIVGLSDDLLSAVYRTARFTVFPSIHEGFGLPIVESLAHGTPVITSDFGSMRENAQGGGALLIDPYDDRSLTDAMRQLLLDDPLHGRLAAEAARRSFRTWDQYASETWDYFVGGSIGGSA